MGVPGLAGLAKYFLNLLKLLNGKRNINYETLLSSLHLTHLRMKKVITILICGVLARSVSAGTLEVCPACAVSSITEAIALAQPCDSILVRGGIYKEGNIVVDKELTFIGEDWPVIDGENSSEILTVTANHFSIEGFQIQNVGESYVEDRAGIRIKRGREFTIRNNKFYDAFFAIYLQHAAAGLVDGNTVVSHAMNEANSGNAIHLWYCENIKVSNNFVTGNRDGIYLEFVNHSTIENNISQGNLRYGLHFMFSNHDNYFGNTFRENGAGVAVMYSKFINMRHNLFEQNWGPSSYGLLLKDINDSQIHLNEFRENTTGVFIETSNRLVISQNNFVQNGWALRMSGGCQDAKITQNNFISNSFDLAVSSAGTTNSFEGNYWNDYSGYDLDRDGVGDVPYRPMKLFSYVVSRTPEAMVLLRSLFIDILNFSEKVSPIFTPEAVIDNRPLMREWQTHNGGSVVPQSIGDARTAGATIVPAEVPAEL
jgi:nitrous oxidase accessory protein